MDVRHCYVNLRRKNNVDHIQMCTMWINVYNLVHYNILNQVIYVIKLNKCLIFWDKRGKQW